MLGREVARVVSIGNDQAEEILEEFYQMSVAREYVLKGGIDYAKKIYDLTEGLVRRRYSNSSIEMILGGNFQRALAEAWTPAVSEHRASAAIAYSNQK